MATTPTADQLRALRRDFGTITITTRRTSDTYVARAAGVRRRSASCTMSSEHAARRLACGIFQVADHHLDLVYAATGVFYVSVADPDGLTPTEVKALRALIEAGGKGDITSPLLARTLRNMESRRPGLVMLVNVPADSAGTKPYFGAVVTVAGRAAYEAAKGGA